ncbi:MAG: NTP transferase domain-containing protein, partial [Kordiimonadaceae bacterium]|nr:NTP transferase domain-containing protein [Kordiimonadaceae bacterium]
MRVGIYLSIRNKASRLPGKSLLPLAGQPLIVFMIERIKGICGAESVVVCTSDHPDDAILVQEAETCGVQVFCGSQDDKLRRYLGAAEHYSHDAMLIIDGDDPFISISHAKQTLEALQDEKADMVLYDNLPVGAMAFGIKTSVLRKSVAENPERDTEVWAPFLRQVEGLREVTLHEENAGLVQPFARMTVDYPEDYD